MSNAVSEQLDLDGLMARYPAIMAGGRWQAARLAFAGFALLASVVAGFASLDISWSRFITGFAELVRIIGLMLPPDCGNMARLLLWTKALGETLSIALLGTLTAAVLAFPVSLLAARNVTPAWPIRFTIRRGLDTIRGVNTLIWALIWINVIGLGPFAGVLAIMTTDFGTFGKLFSEAFEAADPKQGEGVIATGGGELHRVRFGLIPQILPALLANGLFRFEFNVRAGVILGAVGAGGIGFIMITSMKSMNYQKACQATLLTLALVFASERVSDFFRARILGGGVLR